MTPALDAVAARCVALAAVRDRVRQARAANDNDHRPCAEARRGGGYTCAACAGRGVLW